MLFIGEVQESYPTRATASSIQLQPNGANELGDLRPMVMINGALYLDTGKEIPMGAANQVDGTIKTNVSQNKKPAEHEQSNFGFVGSEYVIGDGFVQVNIDGKWIVFELEKQDSPTIEYSIAMLDKSGALSWGTATNVQLAQDILMNALVKSAAWEGVDVATLKEYFLIRQTFPETDEVHDYYAYRLPDGTAVLQTGIKGRYSVLSEELELSLLCLMDRYGFYRESKLNKPKDIIFHSEKTNPDYHESVGNLAIFGLVAHSPFQHYNPSIVQSMLA